MIRLLPRSLVPVSTAAGLLLLLPLLAGCDGSSTSDAAPVGRASDTSDDSPRERDSTDSVATDSGAADSEAVRVRTIEVRPGALEESVWTTGEMRADESVELRAEEEGRVVQLAFREGQRVDEGQLLVKINDEDLQADLRRARVQKQLAEQRERRTKSLLDERTVSQEIYDEALGQLKIVEANIESIEANIRQTEVRAPFSGIVGLRQVSEGSFVTSSQVIATLQRLDPIKIDFSVPEKYAAEIVTGERVDFTVAGLEPTFRGQVYAREPRVDPSTRTVQLRARAPNADGKLLPGAFAKVRLVLSSADGALTVPAIAVVPGNESTTVWVVADGRAAPRVVEVGQRTEQQVEILRGLEPGERVVVEGVQQMRPGLAVNAVAVNAVDVNAVAVDATETSDAEKVATP